MQKDGVRIEYKKGQKIGSCFFEKDIASVRSPNGALRRRAEFMCECGKKFLANMSSVKQGDTSSCGCRFIKSSKERTKTHGATVGGVVTKEFGAWKSMKARCYNKNNRKYYRYGERGIRVCKRWLSKNGYQNFFNDMGKKPSDKHSLDRINNNGNYTPKNCRWATPDEQAANKSTTVLLEYKGVIYTKSKFCKKLGISDWFISNRINKHGDSKEDAVKKAEELSIRKRGILKD